MQYMSALDIKMPYDFALLEVPTMLSIKLLWKNTTLGRHKRDHKYI